MEFFKTPANGKGNILMDRTFSTLDITKFMKIPRERLRSWMKEGYIKPCVQAKGRGTKAEFTKRDLYIVAIFESLLNRGIKRIVASTLINRLLKEDNTLSYAYLIIRYGSDKETLQINPCSAKALGVDLITGAIYRPQNQFDNYLKKDKTGKDVPFMPFNQRSQASVFNSTEDWDCVTILNISGIKERVDSLIVKLIK